MVAVGGVEAGHYPVVASGVVWLDGARHLLGLSLHVQVSYICPKAAGNNRLEWRC